LESSEVQGERAIPFLKWAGGKRWLVDKYRDLFVLDFDRYVEPFLGSGAVFFSLAPERSIISDSNRDLIDSYKAIRSDWKGVYVLLEMHHELHCKEYYYEVRSSQPKTLVEKAARFIYLNRTCWNGLYRVNLNGDFNVPIGSKKNVILESDDFEVISERLRGSEIVCSDFESVIDRCGDGDFLFIDPPYTVKHNCNGFVKYNEDLFSWGDQIRLRNSVAEARDRGAKVIVTNAAHDSIKELYQGLGDLQPFSRNSSISGRSDRRGVYEELVIKCI